MRMAQDTIRTPSSMAGIMSFSDSTGSAIQFDPKVVFAAAVVFVLVVVAGSLFVKF